MGMGPLPVASTPLKRMASLEAVAEGTEAGGTAKAAMAAGGLVADAVSGRNCGQWQPAEPVAGLQFCRSGRRCI